MGTRNLTMVILNGKTKVAQYGQWDGYPSGQGRDILEFLSKVDISDFKNSVKKVKWLTKKQIKELENNGEWEINHPYLSRDCAAKILSAIHFGEMTVSSYLNKDKTVKVDVLGLIDKSEFAADSLFCEWAYVIDLDKNTFEVYEGFNQTPLSEKDRFFYLQKEGSEYSPVKMIASFNLSELPKEDDFLKETEREEVEEE